MIRAKACLPRDVCLQLIPANRLPHVEHGPHAQSVGAVVGGWAKLGRLGWKGGGELGYVCSTVLSCHTLAQRQRYSRHADCGDQEGCMLRSVSRHSCCYKGKERACRWPTLCSSGQVAQLTCLAAQSGQQESRWGRSGLGVYRRTGQGFAGSEPVHARWLAEGHPGHAVLLTSSSHCSGQAD